MKLFRPNQHCHVDVLVNYTLFSCQVLFIQQCYLHMASHDAKLLNPRKWVSEEQLFSLPLGFILYERQLEMLC